MNSAPGAGLKKKKKKKRQTWGLKTWIQTHTYFKIWMIWMNLKQVKYIDKILKILL